MSSVKAVLPSKDAFIKGFVLVCLVLISIVMVLKVMPAAYAAKARSFLFPV